MKIIAKATSAILTALMLVTVLFVIPASADSAGISCDTNVFTGDTFWITFSYKSDSHSNTGAIKGSISYDKDMLECVEQPSLSTSGGECYVTGSAGNYTIQWVDTSTNDPTVGNVSTVSLKFKFKALKSGSAGISTSAEIRSFDEAQTTTKSAQTRIYITDRAALSNNADLKGLIISAGKLSPSFSPSVTTYNVTVENSVTEVLISATTKEDAATIKVGGSSKMKVGDNQRTVTVTAPAGNKKVYTINIKRLAAGETAPEPTTSSDVSKPDETLPENPYRITVDGGYKYMINDYSLITVPDGFSSTVIHVNDIDVPAVTDPVNNVTLVYATDEDGSNGGFYIYDADSGTFSVYRYFMTSSARYVIYDYTEKKISFGDYCYATCEIGGYTFGGFKYADTSFSDFVIFYGATADGRKGFYRYDAKDGSVQRAVEFTKAFEAAEKSKDGKNIFAAFMGMSLKNKLVVAAGAVVILLAIALAVIMAVRAYKNNKAEQQAADYDSTTKQMDGEESGKMLYLGEFGEEEKPTDENSGDTTLFGGDNTDNFFTDKDEK